MTRRAGLAALAAAALAVGAAGCGDSPEDDAHDQGRAVGEAMRTLGDAQTSGDIQTGAQALRSAVGAVGDDVSDRVRNQVRIQGDHLNAVIGKLQQAASSDRDVAAQARTDLQSELQQMRAQAESFEGSTSAVANAFWDGVTDGYDDPH